jgi:glycine cleavage system transcriptional repressor
MAQRSYRVLSLVGPDRPGIVDEVSQQISGEDCNIEDSRMAVLGGDFALMMLFSGESGAPERADERIRRWAVERGMLCASKSTTTPGRPTAAGKAAEIGVEMPDCPGIVARVTHFLAERGANVESLETEVRPAPFTGTPIFSMNVNIRAAGRIEMEKLRRALQDLANDEDIHITLGTSVCGHEHFLKG